MIKNNFNSIVSINLEGGLGNQLFKIFTTISYSLMYNKNFKFNRSLSIIKNKKLDKRNTYWDTLFKSIKNHIYNKKILFNGIYKEQNTHKYKKLVNYNKNIMLKGYFQNCKYFEKKYNKIIEILKLDESQLAIKNKYLKKNNVISIHFRKGDYKNLKNIYIILNINYYIKALKYILENDKSNCNEVLCVYESKDEKEVSKMIEYLEDIFINIKFIKVSHELKDWEQMLLMSVCKHNIIANSTFSWWSAYMNKNIDKIVCCPKKWFVKPKNLDGLFLKEWKIIKNEEL